MLDEEAYQQELHQLAEGAESLQGRVNLHIGWAMIVGCSVSPELYDANAQLVDATRKLREVARQASEDQAFQRGVRQAEQGAGLEPARDGADRSGPAAIDVDRLLELVRGMPPGEFAGLLRQDLPAQALLRLITALPNDRLAQLLDRARQSATEISAATPACG